MRKKWFRAVAAFLAAAFVMAVVPKLDLSVEVSAETNGIQQKIDELLKVYPTGSYFSANGQACGSGCGLYCTNCNIRYIPARGGLPAGNTICTATRAQCCSFATYAFGYIFGHDITTQTTVSTFGTPQYGDCVKFNGPLGVHWAICLDPYGDGESWYAYESNYPHPNKVAYRKCDNNGKWLIKKSKIIELYHANNYDEVLNSGQPSGSPMTSGAGRTIPDGDYYIASYDNDDYVMTVSGPVFDNGANIQLWNSYGDTRQVFSIKYLNNGFYSIINKYTGKSLDVEGQSMLRNTNIHQWDCHGGDSQQWSISKSYNADTGYNYTIKSRLNGWTIDLDCGIVANGTNIHLWEEPCYQYWKLIPCGYWSGKPLSDGYYSLKNKYSGYGIGVNGTLASQTDVVSTFASDRFKLSHQSDGYYKISLNDYCFDVFNSSKYNGANVQYYTPHNQNNQKWFIKSAGDGYYYIISRVNQLFLTYNGSSIVTGNWSINNDDKFKWKIEHWRDPILVSISTDPITYGQTLEDLNLSVIMTGDDEIIAGHGEWASDIPRIPTVEYATNHVLSVKFIPDDTVTWNTAWAPVRITVNPAEYPPNRPSETISASKDADSLNKVPLPENWEWADKDTPLETGVPVTAEAIYTGDDANAGNFIHEKVTVTVTRQLCSHPEDKCEIRNALGPSCTEPGYTGDVYCTECGAAIETGTETKALGHSWSGYEKDETGHTRICSRCNETDTGAHDLDGGAITKTPTCTEEGEITYTCLTCGYQNTKISQKLSHQFGDWEKNEAYHWEECEVCHEHRNETLHTFGDWTVTIQPTSETEGEKSRSCDICGYKETEKIDRLEQPTESSTESPTESPTETPSESPTETPSESPAETPSEPPTETPSESPTETPTISPTVTTPTPIIGNFTVPETTTQNESVISEVSTTVPPVSKTEETTPTNNTAIAETASTEANLPHISTSCESGINAPAAAISSSLSELTEIISEKAELKNGLDITVLLTVNNISDTVSKTDKAFAETALNDYTAAMYLDISLSELIDGEVLKITDTKMPLSVTVEIPTELRRADREFALIRIHNRKAELLRDVDGNPDTVTVMTDRFSTYVVAYKDAEKTDERDKNIATGAMLTALPPAAAAATVVIALRKRRK